jgi:hypothetical protein
MACIHSFYSRTACTCLRRILLRRRARKSSWAYIAREGSTPDEALLELAFCHARIPPTPAHISGVFQYALCDLGNGCPLSTSMSVTLPGKTGDPR